MLDKRGLSQLNPRGLVSGSAVGDTRVEQSLEVSSKLKRMKRDAYLINTPRGEWVDRNAIVRALESRHLAGYAGDVWFPQPALVDHPWRRMLHNGMPPARWRYWSASTTRSPFDPNTWSCRAGVWRA